MSDDKRVWSTGAQRDDAAGKPDYSLVPLWWEERQAIHHTGGAEKYGRFNWQKGMPLSQTYASARRHLKAMVEGRTDEDHAAAAAWNIMVFDWTLRQIKQGNLPAELDDRKEVMDA